MANDTEGRLTIERASEGGFIVTRWLGSQFPCDILLAATSIDEALKFIRDKMAPAES